MIKACYNPHKDEVRISDQWECHAHIIGKRERFDEWVRLIIWPELKRVYIRGYRPHGDYQSAWTDLELDEAYEAADKAINSLIGKKIVKKAWKVLYWSTDNVITPEKVRV